MYRFSFEDFIDYFDFNPRQEMRLLEKIIQRELSRGKLASRLDEREREAFIKQCRHRIEDRLNRAAFRTPTVAMLEALKGRFLPRELHQLVSWINEPKPLTNG
jgi:hypothetical protein